MAHLIDDNRRSRLAAIMQDIGQVALASVAIPFLFNDYQPTLALGGILFALAFWCGSLLFSK